MDVETARAAVMAVGTLVGAWIAARVSKKGSAENKLIDQYQERQEHLDKRLDLQQTQLDKLAAQIARLVHRDLLWDFHATRIEGQVRELHGEPYPRPDGLHPLEPEES